MLERIISILFPVFAITAIGYFVSLRRKPDMAQVNQLIADVFVPALVFGALAGRDFHIYEYRWLALAMLLVTIACGAVGFVLARILKVGHRVLVPPMMFSNSVNLGVPVAVLAFGDRALQPAIVLFLISSLLHYSYGLWLLDHQARVSQMWRVPSLLAMLAGIAVSLLGIQVWQPAVTALRMLGDICIPLMLFALGVRLTDISFKGWSIGVISGLVRPAAGMILSWAVAELLGMQGFEKSLLVIYGALPPAVMNYIFAERYNADPDRVASIVLIGNLLSLVILPLALALALQTAP
ncbi:AEC family transporter [Uliginosibacterium sp. 31-16]|uniref:AEC family transporter n=1 Tax=Uliginosibacterium sp. 31-16 TaxID=3068315 RepID=UPI00273FB1E1|nr:AEC family transporter [Uliginosibacterium sp. 31-16]MDP5238701.1 AEC family transporter [Uliginosibacterium sp. 31-16]